MPLEMCLKCGSPYSVCFVPPLIQMDDANDLFEIGHEHCSPSSSPAPRYQEDTGQGIFSFFRRFGSLFCCPPTRCAIIRKLAFQPPCPPTYILKDDDSRKSGRRLQVITTSEVLSGRVLSRAGEAEVFTVRKKDNSQVALFRLTCKPNKSSEYTVLFSHGNATDLGRCLPFVESCVRTLEFDFVAYDYSGYGASVGVPSEENMLSDAEAVFNFAVTEFGIPSEKIILFGESIGSVPSLHLATKEKVRGLVLQGALASAVKMVFPSIESNMFGLDCLRNIERIPLVRCPVLFIHGTNDEVVNIEHARQLMSRCTTAVEPLWVEGAGHCDCTQDPRYASRVKQFIQTLR